MPRIIDNAETIEAISLITEIYRLSAQFQLTVKKNRWRNSKGGTYDSYLNKIKRLTRWINQTIIPELLVQNALLPKKHQKTENQIRRMVMPHYWKSEWVIRFFTEYLDMYEAGLLSGEYVTRFIFAFESFRTFYRDISQMKYPVTYSFVIEGKKQTRSAILKDSVRIGEKEDYFVLCHQYDVQHSDAFSHGLKITQDVAEEVIKTAEEFVKKYKGEYNKLASEILMLQLLTGSRITAATKLQKQHFIWFKESEYIENPTGDLWVGALIFDRDKGYLTRVVPLTQTFKNLFYKKWKKLKKPDSPYFEAWISDESGNRKLMSKLKMRSVVQEIIHEACDIWFHNNKNILQERIGHTMDKDGKVRDMVFVTQTKKSVTLEKEYVKHRAKAIDQLVPLLDDNNKISYDTIQISQLVEFRINTHSMRKAYLDTQYKLVKDLTHHDLNILIELYKTLQAYGYHKRPEDVEKRIESQRRRLNAYRIEVLNENRERVEKGLEPKPVPKALDFNQNQKAQLYCSLLAGHSRYEIVGINYCNIPEEDRQAGKAERKLFEAGAFSE